MAEIKVKKVEGIQKRVLKVFYIIKNNCFIIIINLLTII
jgi:hypothetical protein